MDQLNAKFNVDLKNIQNNGLVKGANDIIKRWIINN